MKRLFRHSRSRSILCGLLLIVDAPRILMAEPTTADTTAFNLYWKTVESRLAAQHRSPGGFLAPVTPTTADTDARLRRGEFIIEQLSTPPTATRALLHHWRGTAFAPGAHAADFLRLMQDFNAYPQHFSPQVVDARSLSPVGSHMQAWMRVRQRHVITVVMDTTYDVTFAQLDTAHGYSISRSTHIDEIDSPGTKNERVLSVTEEHGFLWRLNTYWSYEERDGGLYLQIESVTLTRSIPHGLAWVVRPFVESIPRESLDFTLRSACNALRK